MTQERFHSRALASSRKFDLIFFRRVVPIDT